MSRGKRCGLLHTCRLGLPKVCIALQIVFVTALTSFVVYLFVTQTISY